MKTADHAPATVLVTVFAILKSCSAYFSHNLMSSFFFARNDFFYFRVFILCQYEAQHYSIFLENQSNQTKDLVEEKIVDLL